MVTQKAIFHETVPNFDQPQDKLYFNQRIRCNEWYMPPRPWS